MTGDDRPRAGAAAAVAPPPPPVAAALPDLIPLVLVIVGEAAWISVVGGLVQAFTLREAVLVLPAMALFVGAGVVVARVSAPRLGDRWPVVAFGLIVGAAVAGVLASAEAQGVLGDGPAAVIATHPGGLLAGLALLRGFAHARLPLAEDTVTNLFGIGLPGIAVAAAIGGVIGEPIRSRFLEATFVAAIVFVGSAVLALAIARIDAMGLDAGFDWRRNPTWLVLAILLVAAAIALAVPLAAMAGTLISVVLSIAIWPMLVVGLVSGFDRTVRRIFLFFVGAVVVVIVLIRLFGQAGEPLPPTGGEGSTQQQPASMLEQLVSAGLGSLVLLAAVVGMFVLIALWMRRARPMADVVGETRVIDTTPDDAPAGRPRRFRRRPAPTTAVEAYVALLEELDRHGHVRREPAETPAHHAARLRASGGPDLSLDLLAADYALARYGGAMLSAGEDRRAIGRWRILRKRLLERRLAGGAGSATAPDAERPADLEPRRTVQA